MAPRKVRNLAEIEAENKRLRRRVARLEKRLDRYVNASLYDEPEELPVAIMIPTVRFCLECSGTTFSLFKTPTKAFDVCTTCKNRTTHVPG